MCLVLVTTSTAALLCFFLLPPPLPHKTTRLFWKYINHIFFYFIPPNGLSLQLEPNIWPFHNSASSHIVSLFKMCCSLTMSISWFILLSCLCWKFLFPSLHYSHSCSLSFKGVFLTVPSQPFPLHLYVYPTTPFVFLIALTRIWICWVNLYIHCSYIYINWNISIRAKNISVLFLSLSSVLRQFLAHSRYSLKYLQNENYFLPSTNSKTCGKPKLVQNSIKSRFFEAFGYKYQDYCIKEEKNSIISRWFVYIVPWVIIPIYI